MKKKDWFTITALAPAGSGKKNARIKLQGIIGGGYFEEGTSAAAFMRELEALGDVGEIELLVDSPGGSVAVGWALFNALELHPARIVATIIGTAASMASVVILAADEIRIPENGSIMIHRASGGARGTHEEVARAAEVIKQFEDGIVAAYVKRTKQAEKVIREMMATLVGTWLFGKEAVAKGFADKILPGVKATAFNAEWVENFEFVPAALFDTRTNPNPQTNNNDPADMKPEEIIALVTKTVGEQLATNNKTQHDAITASMGASITAALTPALETALKPVTDRLTKLEESGGELAKITARLDTAEGLIRSGVAGKAGGTTAQQDGGEGGGEGTKTAPKNEKELNEALAKCKTFAEERDLVAAYDARK